jgi:hypothetical protein
LQEELAHLATGGGEASDHHRWHRPCTMLVQRRPHHSVTIYGMGIEKQVRKILRICIRMRLNRSHAAMHATEAT